MTSCVLLTLSSFVRTESRYGTNFFGSVNPLITIPSVSRFLLMLTPSFNRSPLAQVWLTRSLPAKSTKLILLSFVWAETDCPKRFVSSVIFNITLNIECDLELLSFIPVDAVFRRLFPRSSQLRNSAYDSTLWTIKFSTNAKLLCCRNFSGCSFGVCRGVDVWPPTCCVGVTDNKSYICSL